MKQHTDFRVPRSRTFQTHQSMRTELLDALKPILFESMDCAKHARNEVERMFAPEVQQEFACAVHSGTVGLFLALRASGIQPADEVITVGNSDVSTTAAISHCRATPVLCDVKESDYTIDPDRITPLISERTAAILPVDLHGHPADVKRLRSIADQYDLKIVEDAALATGAADYGLPVGAFADATVFSFAPYKPLGSVGNGGMVTTNDEVIARRLRLLVHYGHVLDRESTLPGHQKFIAEGYNIPLDPLQAAIVSVKLPYLDAWTDRRRSIVAAYEDGLYDTDAILPSFRAESSPTFRSYTIRVPNQAAAYQKLRQAGIEVVLHYTPPTHHQPVYEDRLPGAGKLSVTERLAQDLLCLPVTVELTDVDIQFVIETVRSVLDMHS